MSQYTMSPHLTHNLIQEPQTTMPSAVQKPMEALAVQAQPNNRVYAFVAIGAFAFVVGVLVTLQFARMTMQPTQVAIVAPAAAPTVTAEDILASASSLVAPDVGQENLVTRAQGATALTTALATQTDTGGLTTDDARNAQVALMQRAASRLVNNGTSAATLQQAITRQSVNEVNRGRDTNEVEDLLRNAANNGLIEVPTGLVDSNGSVDTRSLLLSLVEQAVDEEATTNGVATVTNVALNTTRPVAAPTGKLQYYTVVSGDSLAAISLLHYGDVGSYTRIFNANRNVLASPDRIQIGQRLLIPNV
jgi:nucleoid-associated protein YgaU